MKKFRTRLVVEMWFEQEREDDEEPRPNEFIEDEIEDAFGCTALILERSDKECE